MAGYLCSYCGSRFDHPDLAGNYCSVSPTNRHEIIADRSEHVCRFCGFKSVSPNFAGYFCAAAPLLRHRLVP